MRPAVLIVSILLGASLLLGPFAMTPRGIRNNNPGNIRHGPSRWLGMREVQTDAEFVQFTSPEWGIRAMGIILRNYRELHDLHTMAAMLRRWAPPSENDTEAYIASVSRASGIAPGQVVRDENLPRLIAAMIQHENGRQPYDLALINRGVQLA